MKSGVEKTETVFPRINRVNLVAELHKRTGVNVGYCWHCRCCSGGCPFSEWMDYLPNQVLRMVQLGLKEEVLGCSAIWICVGCHTCSMECPQAIDMASMMDALRQMAIREGIAAAEPDIVNFHEEVLDSIRRYGRTHKLEIMMHYKLRKRDLLSDVDVGLRMLSKRKLDLYPSEVGNIAAIRKIFQQSGERRNEK